MEPGPGKRCSLKRLNIRKASINPKCLRTIAEAALEVAGSDRRSVAQQEADERLVRLVREDLVDPAEGEEAAIHLVSKCRPHSCRASSEPPAHWRFPVRQSRHRHWYQEPGEGDRAVADDDGEQVLGRQVRHPAVASAARWEEHCQRLVLQR